MEEDHTGSHTAAEGSTLGHCMGCYLLLIEQVQHAKSILGVHTAHAMGAEANIAMGKKQKKTQLCRGGKFRNGNQRPTLSEFCLGCCNG